MLATELPHESLVLGLTGSRAGLARPQLEAATRELHRATEALDAARNALGFAPTPFDVLCADHGIGQIGALVLLFVIAPELWGDVARAYAICADDPARAVCDRHLLVELVGDLATRHDLARELNLDEPLVRQGILRIDGTRRPFAALAADPRMVERFAGAAVDHGIEPGLTRIAATVRLENFLGPEWQIQRGLADLRCAGRGPGRLVVGGAKGAGRRTLLATLAHEAGRTLAMIDGAALVREDRVRALAELLERAHLRGWLPCVDGLELVAAEDHPKRDVVREVLRGHPGPLAARITGHVEPPLDPGYVRIDLWRASRDERAQQWRQIAGASRLTVSDPMELAERFPVGPGAMHAVVAAVAGGLGSATPGLSVDRQLELELRHHVQSQLGSIATRVTRLPPWSHVVLPGAAADRIAELMARIRHRRMVYDNWGFDSVTTTSRGITALFQGGPGTGKTLLAGAIAGELGLDLYRVDLARVLSKWVGETEQNLARVFDAAELGHAMILFDEADALFGHRSEVRTATDRYANFEINYLLQRLDTFEGVAVLTTNLSTAIDPAFHRRLSCHITLPFPDAAARERLWRVHLPPQLPVAGAIDLGELARRYEMSGGYIRNAALRAAFLAAEENSPLTQFHLERAIRAELHDGGPRTRSSTLP